MPLLGPRSGIYCTTEAADSFIAQINSQSILATPRHENRKIQTRKRNFKSTRTTSDLSNDTKKHTSKSSETIPLFFWLA
jgi:hypothetical protein